MQQALPKTNFRLKVAALAAVACAFAGLAPGVGAQDAAGESVRVVTYNIENWRNNFEAFKLDKRAATQPSWPEEFIELINRERREDDEENWEVARVILDPAVMPDVLLIQEGANQADLNYFNSQFLGRHFEYVHVFATNTGRDQHTAILARPGFKVIEVREDYHKMPDVPNVATESDYLFARGPAFVLMESPGGNRFWVGTNHQKAKGFNTEKGETGVTSAMWRGAESDATHRIIQELRKTGTPEVIFAGDLNDELGIQEFDAEAGGSAIERLAGTGPDALLVVTQKLSDDGAISFHGQRRGQHRSFIDHALVSPELADNVGAVSVFTGPMADVASDHYPVVVELRFD